jgi:hypothetical protein
MAYRWINWHLKDNNEEVSEPPLPKFEGKELRVFPEDMDLPTDSLNGKIDQSFVPRGQPKPPENAAEFQRWQGELVQQLRAKSFRDWPDQIPAAELLGEKEQKLLLATEPGIGVTAFRAASPRKTARAVVVLLNPDEAEDKTPEWTKPFLTDQDTVFLLSPRGCGGLKWSRKNPPNYVERAHALLGRTVDTGRVWDVQAFARWLHETDYGACTLVVAGKGQAGVLAAYAALLESAVNEVIAFEPPASHMDGPVFLNVLRVLDVPDAFGLLAPRRMTLVGARDRSFERTAKIYRAAGVAEQLRQK